MEVCANAEPLAEALFARRLLGDSLLHGYHCSCPTCDFDESRFPLRAQRDSSCAGEFISSVFDTDEDMDRAREVMRALQDCAIEVDAEPGYTAGFHVHVSWPRPPMRNRRYEYPQLTALGQHIWQFMEWELVLCEIAAGRFLAHRDSMNTRVCDHWMRYLERNQGWYEPSIVAMRRRFSTDDGLIDDSLGRFIGNLHTYHRDVDRHSNLNVRTRYETFEYRVWNSTRSAWRMELWCLLSLAFMDRQFYDAARIATLAVDPSIELLMELLNNTGHECAAELLQRQYAYMATRPIESGLEPAFTVAV